jgi:hypothetical protein
MKSFIAFLGVLLVQHAALVQIKVTSRCSFPIWIAVTSNPGKPDLPGANHRLDNGASINYQIPNAGWAGRMWPKIGCDGSGQNCFFGQSSPPCPAGGCHPPADTKVEFFFPANFQGQSWYDISLVDGYSQPVSIRPSRPDTGSCVYTDCRINLNSCPTNEKNGLGNLKVTKSGQLVACLSPCKRWNYPPPYGFGKNEHEKPGVYMCCPTPPITPQQCSAGLVVQTNYVREVRSNCPSAYSYAYDDKAGLHNCPGDTSFDVTFCP